MECETEVHKCDNCVIGDGTSPICLWFKENSCSNKCQGYKGSLLNLKLADSKKIKKFVTTGEITLQKKLRKYLPLAVSIDQELTEQEATLIREKKKKQMEQMLKDIEDLDDELIEPKQKYKNIKSLI